MANYNYTEIFSQAIDDFNNIQNAISEKSSNICGKTTSGEYIETSSLNSLIRDNLTYPSGDATLSTSNMTYSSSLKQYEYDKIASRISSGVNRTSISKIIIPEASISCTSSIELAGTNTQERNTNTITGATNLYFILTPLEKAPTSGRFVSIISGSSASGKSGSLSITKDGWITSGSNSSISASYNSSSLTKYYSVKNAQYDATTDTFSSGYVGSRAVLSDDGSYLTSITGASVEPGEVSISSGITTVDSGKTYKNITSNFLTDDSLNISNSIPTDSSYYLVLKGNVAEGSVQSKSIAGVAKSKITTAGYADTSMTTSKTVGGTIAVHSSKKNSDDLYIKVPMAKDKDGIGWSEQKATVSADITKTTATGYSYANNKLTINGYATAKPVVTKDGYIKTTYSDNLTGRDNVAIHLDVTETNLLAENIKHGVTILGVTGTFTNFDNYTSDEDSSGNELHCYKVTSSDTTHPGSENTHYHSLDMRKGAIAYVEGKLVYGVMNDFSRSTTSTSPYNVSGDGTSLQTNKISVSGNNVTFTSLNTGYIAANITTFTGSVGESLTKTLESKSTTFKPSTNKLISSITVTAKEGSVSSIGTTTINTNADAPVNYGDTILSYDDNKLGTASAKTEYVTVSATGTSTASVSAGWISDSVSGQGSSDKNYIPAIKGSTVTVDSSSGLTISGDKYVIGDYKVAVQKGGTNSSGTITSHGELYATNSTDTSPTDDKGSAKILDNDVSSGYVTVDISENASSWTSGWVDAGSFSARNKQIKIAAIKNKNLTVNTSLNKNIVAISQFNASDGYFAQYTDGRTAHSYTEQIYGASSSQCADTYIIGGISASISGNATINIGDSVTGSKVDSALTALYRRIHGSAYIMPEQ